MYRWMDRRIMDGQTDVRWRDEALSSLCSIGCQSRMGRHVPYRFKLLLTFITLDQGSAQAPQGGFVPS